MRIIAIYPGRFQPFGKNHKAAYDQLVEKFGAENTFIATSNSMGETSPFSFDEKKKIIENFGISPKNIIFTKNPYKAEEITSLFDPNTTAVVFMYGEKDAGRIRYVKKDGTRGYFQEYTDDEKLLPLNVNGYIFVSNGTVSSESGDIISGTLMRQKLKTATPQEFENLMGWFNEEIYNLIRSKLDPNFNNLKKEEMVYELLLGESNISVNQLRSIESYADSLFKEFGIDVELQDAQNSHFYFRLNDRRNNPPISFIELRDIFRKAAKKYGQMLATKYDGFSAVLKDMASNINIPFMISIDKKNKEIDLIPKTIMRKANFLNREKSLHLDEGYIIVEGGAAGHLMHPWDNDDLTFLDLQEIISKFISGNADSERYISEKPDGQNLFITVIDGKVLAARNKATLRAPLSASELFQFFETKPENVQKAFHLALLDLENAFKQLPSEKIIEIFNNGKRFLNLEILHPENKNVINYNLPPTIQLHGLISFDDDLNITDSNFNIGTGIVEELEKVDACQQKIFKIISHHKLILTTPENQFDEEDKYLELLKDEMAKYNLSWASTIEDYKIAKWNEIINTRFPTVSPLVKNILINRWAREISQKLTSQELGNLFDEIKSFDTNERRKVKATILKPLELLFLSFGTMILKNVEHPMAASKTTSLSDLKKELLTTIEKVEKCDDESIKDKLHLQLSKIASIGGLENLSPMEGLVFIYKGLEYKLTGLFTPINQILGFFRYSDRK